MAITTDSGGTAFVGATLLDGTGGPPLPDSAVVVDGGRITWVGTATALDRTPGLRVIDVTGRYVLPGLMDANVHLVLNLDPEVLLPDEPTRYDDLVIEAAQVTLRAGVTTVFDTWGPLEALRRVRDRIAAGEVTGSRIYCAGNIIGNAGPWSADFFAPYATALNPVTVDRVNRHWEQGVGADLTWLPAADVRTKVRHYIATSGIDFVKFASSAHAHYRFLALSPHAQRAIVEEAHAAGLTAQACTLTPEALKVTIEAGADLLQHGNSTGRYPLPVETLETIARRRLPCVALLYTERCLAAMSTAPGLPANFLEVSRIKRENGRRLIAANALLVHATDGGVFGRTAGTSPWVGPLCRLPELPIRLGSGHALWVRAAVELGMDPMDALLACTRNVARAYRREDELGTVEPGKRADLLVLEADPLTDPDNYTRIAHVVKDGEPVDLGRLPEHPILTR